MKRRDGVVLSVVCLVALVFTSTSSHALHAVPDYAWQVDPAAGHAFSIRGSIGVLNGEAGEYVYDGSHKLSELTWDLSQVIMAGLIFSSRIGERFSVNAGFWTALNDGNGEMTDYDWFIEGLDWTHYSRSDVKVESARVFDINAGFMVFERGAFRLSALAGYKHEFWEWSDEFYEYIYSSFMPPFYFRDIRGSMGGVSAIDYEQTYNIPYVGLNAAGQLGHNLNWSVYFLYSPIVKAEDKDHHKLREDFGPGGVHYEETFKNIDYIAFGATAAIQVNDNLQIGGQLHAQNVPESRGDMYIVEAGETFKDAAGLSHDSVTVSLTATWNF